MPELLAAIGIQAFAFCVFLYRARGQALSPDGKFYAAMAEGVAVPSPYARRWLLPYLLRSRRAWVIASGAAFVAVGPLTYGLTGSLACVWLMAWLPGLATNVRFPVLVDQVAFTLVLLAAVLYGQGYILGAALVLVAAGQCKEVGPVFGALLCPHPLVVVIAGLGMLGALAVGLLTSVEGDEEYMRHPFRVAMTKHDPLCWRSMLLPWGGVAIVAVAGLELKWVAGLSLAAAYGQLILANDEGRLFVWAAPAVLLMVAGYEGAWLVPALVAHPFLCGMVKRV